MRLLAAYRHYPVSIARFFVTALRRQGHQIDTVGPYGGDEGGIPWPGQPKFPQWVDRPKVQIYQRLLDAPAWQLRDLTLKDYDATISFDAGFRLTGPFPEGVRSVLYGTDPHARPYDFYQDYDHYFSAQRPNLEWQPGGVWIPLGYDPAVHRYQIPLCERTVDICFVGVLDGPSYVKRQQGLELLSEAGYNVMAATGLVYDDCTAVYNRAKIAYNVSASWDIPMRFFEAFGYGCCNLTNRLPYLEELGFTENKHYMAFDSPEELLDKTAWLLKDDHWQTIAQAGRERALEVDCTYDARARQLVEALS